ncbi:MAG: hypothetical protein IKP24_03640 [Alphaproteobacteria bacterium]|nr:hypothetical protein [Alphaproteobacteria bacterium]
MYKIFTFLLSLIVSANAFAEDKCVAYKIRPLVRIEKPNWVKKVGQPLQMMDLYHGNVVATLVDEYNIVVNIDELPDNEGFCVGIKDINATIGYSDFLVKVDMRHKLDSCSYKAVLAHEGEHITAYLSVIDDFQNDLKKSVYSAANSIIPIFVKNEEDIADAIDDLNNKLQTHPDMILVKQKISAEEELRNAKVDDENKQYEELLKCNG